MQKLLITTAVLASLAGAGVAQTATDDDMRGMTNSVLAGLTGQAPAAAAPSTNADLKQLVEQAMSEGQSDAYMEALLGEAIEKGTVEVSPGMRSTDGEVDTKTLLAALVAKSGGLGSEVDTTALDAEANGAVVQVAMADQYHVVVTGDSLAAIAVTYYDSALAYTRIFEANRDTLSSPDRIRVGQRLLIPR